MKHSSRKHAQSGNVFFIIFIAIALLVSLSYAITQSNQGSVKAVTDETARLYASEIMEYAGIVSKAVGQLRLRGCLETEISFEHDFVTGYENTNAPSDNTCHVFHPSGGGVSWQIPQAGMLSSATAPNDAWGVYDGNSVDRIGTNGNNDENVDLILALKNVDLTVCTKLNELLNINDPTNAPPDDDGMENSKFEGSFTASIVLANDDTALQGQKSACYADGGIVLSTAQNVFYKVLIAR